MHLDVLYKLLAIFATVAAGWGLMHWPSGKGQPLGAPGVRERARQASRGLSDAAFLVFVPALLFRTMALQDFSRMPIQPLLGLFVPTLGFALLVYLWQQRQGAHTDPAGPATATVAASYGNAVQLGIPMSAALFGASGLALHLALVSVHGLVMLTVLTAAAEWDRARQRPAASTGMTVWTTAQQAVLHPVVLPLLLGVLWNLTGLGLHPVVDETLALLARAVVPVCLILIGVNLAQYGLRDHLKGAASTSALKLLVLPLLVLVFSYGLLGLRGTALGVVVMMSALPVGSNALIFANRYRVLEAQATAAIVTSTVAFAATACLWLLVLSALP